MSSLISDLFSAGLPVVVCVWWSGSHNLLQYLLQRAPKKKTGGILICRMFTTTSLKCAAFFSLCTREDIRHDMFCFLMTLLFFEADVEPMPDMLWPHAKEILCSAVSRCTRYIALGLVDGVVCVWDRQSGEQILW